MNMTLGQLEDELEGDELQNLQEGLRGVKSLTGKDAHTVHVESREKMGDAAGRFTPASGRIEAREDVVEGLLAGKDAQPQNHEGANNHDHFLHVTTHELIHEGGCHNEGWTEWLATLLTRTEPVEALRSQVRHMQVIESIVGAGLLKEQAGEENGELVVLRAYVQERVAQGLGWEKALEEGATHIEAAENYAA